ncbi:MAG: 16S rRNA (cytosine(1402)-N(4))-methyltransferase RsmH [Nitrospinota bacterium]
MSEHGVHHNPVLVGKTLEFLRPRGGTFLDATVGYGGHAEAVLEAGGPGLRLVGVDRDGDALKHTRRRLRRFGDRVTLVKENFSRLREVLDRLGVERLDGALFDLGMSSPQVDRAERGFGWTRPGPLDMRMDRTQKTTAATLVGQLSAAELQEILKEFGEERFSGDIARRIVRARRKAPLHTTADLAAVVASAIPRRFWPPRRHPATRTFQALRIAVNCELDVLPGALEAATERLLAGGRIVVLGYHSLEDRLVKRTFRRLSAGCTCPPRMPVCACGGRQLLEVLTKRPMRPGEEEVRENPRSRSARLRAAERRANG